jgi:hypothetical protein
LKKRVRYEEGNTRSTDLVKADVVNTKIIFFEKIRKSALTRLFEP